jgi:heat-inducible transcriptional repressor
VSSELSDRAQTLLRVLVALHIRDGQPVGSRTLREEAGLPVSPATIRNAMSDLEERGFLHSPHTSAGRVPTAQGYRFFVDSLLQVGQLDEDCVATLRSELHPDRRSSDLVQSASTLLSAISSQAGVVTVPRPSRQPLRQIEFLPLSGDRVLVILVVNQREVQNRIIHTRRVFFRGGIARGRGAHQRALRGRRDRRHPGALAAEILAARGRIDDYLEATLDLAKQALDADAAEDCLIVGESRLLEGATPEQLESLRELFRSL